MLEDGAYEVLTSTIFVPPDVLFHQPVQSYPDLVGVGDVTELPELTLLDEGLTLPPFASHVTV